MEILICTFCCAACFLMGGLLSGGVKLPRKVKEYETDSDCCEQEDKLAKELAMLLSYNGEGKEDDRLDE